MAPTIAPPAAPPLVYSDAAVVPDPDPAQLAEIAIAAAASCRTLLGEEPRVALLSFSTRGSAEHPRVAKVRAAREELARRRVDFDFDGELQADAALVPEVAARKAPGSRVAGRANVLVVPDLEAGNMLAKSLSFLAGADAAGIVLGARVPVILTSRADTVMTRLASCAIATLVADARRRRSGKAVA